MTLVFQTFIDRLAVASGEHDLSQAMTRFVDALGLTKFTYLDFRRPRPHQPVYLTTYPIEWVYHYASRRYQEIDPVVALARSTMLPFNWDNRMAGSDASEEQRRFFGEAAEFGVHCGITIPVHDSKAGLAMISFLSGRKPDEAKRHIDAHRDILHLAAIYFHVHARQKLSDTVPFDPPQLDPQELACLQWILRGKSVWDVGDELNMPYRMVMRHLSNAKRKLGASTLSHAVATALHHKLIEF